MVLPDWMSTPWQHVDDLLTEITNDPTASFWG